MGMARRGIGLAAKVTAAYATFGFIWIAASDTLAEALVADHHMLTVVAMWKGSIFVAASSLLIYAVVRGFSARLDASEARYRLMFAESPMPMMVLDPHSMTVTHANRAVCGYLGYAAAELIGKPLSELHSPDDHAALNQRMPEIRAGIPARGVWRLIRKDGRLADVQIEGRSVALGARNMRMIALTDIGQRRKAETQLLGCLDQLTATNSRLREIDHAISHDLQEPLRQINGFVQLLERKYQGRLDSEADEYIAFAVEGVRRLKALMVDAQRFAAQPVLHLQPVELRAVLDSVLDRLHAEIEKAGAVIVIGRLPRMTADADKLELALFALLDNAVKFRRPEAPCRITVNAERQPSAWVIQVTDNGAGIAPEYHEMVFSLFRRLHGRESISGNGTGLALARKLVQAHGGEIWVESVPGQGSTIRFRLPDSASS